MPKNLLILKSTLNSTSYKECNLTKKNRYLSALKRISHNSSDTNLINFKENKLGLFAFTPKL